MYDEYNTYKGMLNSTRDVRGEFIWNLFKNYPSIESCKLVLWNSNISGVVLSVLPLVML